MTSRRRCVYAGYMLSEEKDLSNYEACARIYLMKVKVIQSGGGEEVEEEEEEKCY